MRKLLRHAIRTHPGVISKLAEAQADLMGLGDEFRAAIAQEQAEIAQDTRQTEALGQTTRVSPTNNNPATSASSENGDLSTLESLGG
jgi:Sec-independent protein translocase protein TatA